MPETQNETPHVNEVPDFAIIGGTVYRAEAIDAVQAIGETTLTVTFSLSGRVIQLPFTEKEEALKAHRLLTYLMTGTDLYAQNTPTTPAPEEVPEPAKTKKATSKKKKEAVSE